METLLDNLREFVKQVWRRARGITLLELVVVLSILAIVSSLVTPAVSGQTTRARGATKAADISTVQRAADVYSGEAPANSDNSPRYPVNRGSLPTASDYHATITSFRLPDGSTTSLYVKPLIFSASFTATDGGGTKSFVPDYLKWMPRRAAITLDADGSDATETQVFSGGTVSFSGGRDYSETGTGAPSPAPTSVSVWVVDQNGLVRLLLDDGYY